MEPIFVETTLDVRDWAALQRHIRGRFLKTTGKRVQLQSTLISMVATVVGLFAVLYLTKQPLTAGFAAFGLFLGFGIMMVCARLQAKAWTPSRDSSFFAPTQFRFDSAGIRAEQAGQSGVIEWASVPHVEETADHIFFSVSDYTAYVIPKRALTTLSTADFVARIQAWYGPGEQPKARIEVPAFVRERSFWRDLGGNLRAGMRMFFLGHANALDLSTGFWQIVALLLIAVLVHLSFDVSQIKETSEFYFWGFYTWFTCVVLVIWVSALITRALNPRGDSRLMIVAALAMAPWAIIAFWGLSLVPDPMYVIFPVLIAVVVFVLGMRVTRVVHGTTTLAAFLIMVVTATLVAVATDKQFLYARLWPDYGANTESEVSTSDADWQAAESLLFDQRERIADAVDELAPERPGVADVFFVGFAGDGAERVFRREALFAEKIFAERMGSGERSIELINDKDDRISYPLGTAAGLRYGLVQIAARMNVEEDVLVLMLTSHGSVDNGIHVSNGNLPLNSVDPDTVLRALDASGIKWRIVIVSACYSGTFVEPLENENTMVITASDAGSTSFGCADDRELTYFGEAFLRDALPEARSLEDAFEAARNAIVRREKMETLSQSNPQISVGDALREKLASLGDLPVGGAPTQ